jgi:hypothetical protein
MAIQQAFRPLKPCAITSPGDDAAATKQERQQLPAIAVNEEDR